MYEISFSHYAHNMHIYIYIHTILYTNVRLIMMIYEAGLKRTKNFHMYMLLPMHVSICTSMYVHHVGMLLLIYK